MPPPADGPDATAASSGTATPSSTAAASGTATLSGTASRLRARVAEAEAAIEALLTRWSARYAARAATEADAALVASFGDEARPAASSLHFATATETALDAAALAHHEALAMLTLLGRRLALLGLSPASAGQGVPALMDAWEGAGTPLPAALADALGAAFVEGFVRGHGERDRERWLEGLRAHQPFLTPEPGVCLWVAVGDLDAARLAERGEAFARDVHRKGARAAIVDLRALPAPSPRRLAAVADALEALAMLGVSCLLLAEPCWHDTAPPGGALRVVSTLAEALAAVPPRRRSRWSWWRRPARSPLPRTD
ncbi:MAG: hypothetical protein AAF447_09280 [Myxococcota bacterium]